MNITYCDFPTKCPDGTAKSLIISALDRFKISPIITAEVNKTYRKIYRASNSCATIIDHPEPQYNKLIGHIEHFDEKAQAYSIKFRQSIPDLPNGDLIEPGFLLSMNTKNYDEGKEIGAKQRRSTDIK